MDRPDSVRGVWRPLSLGRAHEAARGQLGCARAISTPRLRPRLLGNLGLST